MLSFAFFMALGSDVLFVVYGAWLEQSYGLSLTAIGLGTILIGLAEVAGEAITAFFPTGSACSEPFLSVWF